MCQFVGGGEVAVRGLHDALTPPLPNPREWSWIHWGLHNDAGFMLCIATHVHNELFQKTMETSYSTGSFPIFPYSIFLIFPNFQVFFLRNILLKTTFPKQSTFSPFWSWGKAIPGAPSPIPHGHCSSCDASGPLLIPSHAWVPLVPILLSLLTLWDLTEWTAWLKYESNPGVMYYSS